MDWQMDNPYLRQLRDYTMQDALAGQVGAHRAAMNSDPYNAGYASLASYISGQGNTARTLGLGRLQWLKGQQDFQQQMKLLKYQMELQKQAQGNPLLGMLGQAGGTALGAYLGWL